MGTLLTDAPKTHILFQGEGGQEMALGMAKTVQALNRTSYHPNSPLPKAMSFLFEGMGFAHQKLWSANSNEENHLKENEVLFSSEFLILLIIT